MHIVLISGSHREVSQSARIARYLSERLQALETGTTCDTILLKGNPLPLWDERMWQAGSDLQNQWEPYAKRLQAADGLIVVAPEWNGMVPAGLKNFFLYCSDEDVGHKPGLIVAVSASRGGSYPVNELRTSSYKNSKLLYIPEHIIVRDCEKMFVEGEPSGKDDAYLRGRTDFALQILMSYTKALKPMRENDILFNKNYPFGM